MKYVLAFLGSAHRLFALSILLHLAVVLALGHYKAPKTWENGGIAQNVRDGKGFSAGFSRPDELTSWQAPGYPYLLVGSWKLFGQTPFCYFALSILQVIAVSSMLYPIGWLTQRWFGPGAATVARVITVIMPLYLWYATRIHHTAFVMAFHPWLLWSWLILRENPGAWRSILTGAGTGLAGLFQPVLLAVFGIISAVLLFHCLRGRESKRATHILAAGFLTLVVLVPWTIRNYEVHHRLLLVKNSFGKEFWMGNNPHATGTGYAEGGAEEVTGAFPPAAMRLRGSVSEMELMDAMQQEGWEYVKADPGSFVKRTARKITWLWTLTPARYLRSYGGGEALGFRWLHGGYWFLFLLLAGVALGRLRSLPREYLAVLVLYVALYSAVYGLTHVGQARFRGEIEYIFIPMVGAGVVATAGILGMKSLRPTS